MSIFGSKSDISHPACAVGVRKTVYTRMGSNKGADVKTTGVGIVKMNSNDALRHIETLG